MLAKAGPDLHLAAARVGVDDMYRNWDSDGDGRSIAFTGNWREFLPIAASNALLIVVTLGVYRFWAVARQRRYLWSRTHVIDDSLEWSGTGKEMFIGFLVVVAILLPFFLVFQFLLPALFARGLEGAAFALLGLFYVVILWFAGLARFRALRYRLSRSWWHGIRGGSGESGLGYAGQYLGRYALTILTLFIVFPWAVTRLWNARWNAMSFGSLSFSADLDAKGLKGRWAVLYLIPILGFPLAGAAMVAGAPMDDPEQVNTSVGLILLVVGLAIYVGIPLATLAFFAKYYRRAAASTRLGDLEFSFDARSWDWLKLYLGNFALAVVTLGFGLTYWGYRNWSFMVRHARLTGVVDVAALGQSSLAAPGEAEGFADAFDVGAI